MSDLLTASQIRAVAHRLDLHPTKRLGQNFVVDGNTVRRIVAFADLGPEDVVLEVGPGLGSLTLALLPAVQQVIAVEIDPVLAEQLPDTVLQHAPERAGALTVLAADALRVTIDDLPAAPTALVANLPYNVSVPVLLHLLGELPSITSGLVMVQREVGERLAAGPGSRSYGVPSPKAAWYVRATVVATVPRAVFWPVPNVDSVLVRLERVDPPRCRSSRQEVFAVIDAAFSQRRKMLRSALAGWAGSTARAEALLGRAQVAPTRRGETLALDEFVAISDARKAAQG